MVNQSEILAYIIVLEGEVVKLQLRLRDLQLQIREGIEDAESSTLDNPLFSSVRSSPTD